LDAVGGKLTASVVSGVLGPQNFQQSDEDCKSGISSDWRGSNTRDTQLKKGAELSAMSYYKQENRKGRILGIVPEEQEQKKQKSER